MRFTEELVGAGDLDVPAPTRAPTDRDRVRQLVTAKARGEQPVLPEPEASQARTFGWLWVA